MAKKPAITGVARPQGWIDDTLKAVGKRLRKPAEVTVNKGVKSSSVKKVTYGIQKVEKGLPLRVSSTKVKIDSKPKTYKETYVKGTKEYKDAIKAKRREESALKKVNKYNSASVRRGQEYKVARAAEKDVNQMKKTMGKTFSDVLPQKTAVDKFVGMKPRKVKSGRR